MNLKTAGLVCLGVLGSVYVVKKLEERRFKKKIEKSLLNMLEQFDKKVEWDK